MEPESPPSPVIIEDPDRMNLLGLLMGSIIERRAVEPEHQKRLSKLKGPIAVEAGSMAITVHFSDGRIRVTRGADEGARARVRGAMGDLLGIALGGGMVGPFLRGKIKTRGSLVMLLRMLPLMKA